MFWRVVAAEINKNVKQFFFSARVLFWTLALPLGNGLYLYFLYLPFAVGSVSLQFNSSWYTLDLVGFTLIGQLLYTFFTMMLLSGTVFDRERQQGTLEALLLSPANRLAIILGAALASAFNYLWFLLGILLSWVAFLGVNILISDFLALFASVILSYSSIVAIGMFLEAFFIHSRRGIMYATMMQEPIMFFSGLVFPLQALPGALLSISYLIPLTFGLISVRLTLLGGAPLFDVAVPLTVLAAMTITLLALATWFVGYAERNAKAKATLTQF
jgi:ABC-2 type transport system permease protein